MYKSAILPVFLSLCLFHCGQYIHKPVVRQGALLQRVAGDFDFTEGPAADREGNVYFTDQPNNRILKWSVDGELSTFVEPAGRANGLYFDSEGNLVACADEKNELWSISPDKKVTVLASNYEGSLLNGPNDVWVHPDGQLYFTDPMYPRSYWNRGPMEQTCQGVYLLTADRKNLIRVIDDLEQPNGIVGTADGKILYVADIQAKKTYRYTIEEDGSLTHKQVFCNVGSDGMTLDSEGHVYLTGFGVTVFNAMGAMVERIEVPESWTANVCFGGQDGKTLFITASRSLYSIQMRVHGMEAQE